MESTHLSTQQRGSGNGNYLVNDTVASGDSVVTVDTGTVFTGPAIGTNTTGQEAEGPHCITGVGGHG